MNLNLELHVIEAMQKSETLERLKIKLRKIVNKITHRLYYLTTLDIVQALPLFALILKR